MVKIKSKYSMVFLELLTHNGVATVKGVSDRSFVSE